MDEYEISSNQLLQDSRQDDNINGNLPDYSNNIDIAPPEICSVPKDVSGGVIFFCNLGLIHK